MLSEEAKKDLKTGVESWKRRGRLEELQQRGVKSLLPEAMPKHMDANDPDWLAIWNNVQENRKEAEEFLGGLLGMM